MSFKQHSYPLFIEARSSRSLTIIFALLHSLAVFAVMYTYMPWQLKLLAIAVLLTLFGLSVKRATEGITIVWSSEGDWNIRYPNGAYRSAELQRTSVVNRLLIWLHFRDTSGKKFGMVFMRDSLPPDVFRRLRVRLLVDAGTGKAQH